MSSSLKLISFKLCPFVQRSIILLNEKGVGFDLVHIDLQNKPDWFLQLSPTGKVPVLQINDTILFESAVINEYLDEAYPPHLHPDDLIQKAKHRAWIEFSTPLFFDMMNMLRAQDDTSFVEAKRIFYSKMQQVEAMITGDVFADKFSLVDVSFAPLLLRLDFVLPYLTDFTSHFSKVLHWKDTLLDRPSVQRSYDNQLEHMFIKRLCSQNSFVLNSDKKE
jgi:glutathione S-transferase